MELVPTTLKRANEFVAAQHRHHKPTQGHIVSIGAAVDTELVGVAMLGRPVSRHMQDGQTIEVTRLCTDGTRNAASFLLSRAKRLGQALGYLRVITYTLESEDGASLRGAGWKMLRKAGGGTWSRAKRPRDDKHPLMRKLLWEA